MIFKIVGNPLNEVTAMKTKKTKNRTSLCDFGIGLLLGGGVAAVLLLAVYVFVICGW
jgi:hypothetical protein